MNNCTTFRKGLHIFWVREGKPVFRAIAQGVVLACIITWLLVTMIWLVAPMSKTPFWMNCLGGISVVVIVILLAVYLIRHVLRLGNEAEE